MQTPTAPLAHPVPAACQRLSIGRTMLYELIQKGDLRPIKIGHKTLIPESELQRLVSDRMGGDGKQVAA